MGGLEFTILIHMSDLGNLTDQRARGKFSPWTPQPPLSWSSHAAMANFLGRNRSVGTRNQKLIGHTGNTNFRGSCAPTPPPIGTWSFAPILQDRWPDPRFRFTSFNELSCRINPMHIICIGPRLACTPQNVLAAISVSGESPIVSDYPTRGSSICQPPLFGMSHRCRSNLGNRGVHR